MKSTVRNTIAFMAAIALCAVAVAAGAVDPVLAAIGIHGDQVLPLMMLANAPVAMPELKALIESMQKGFEDFKKTNDERLGKMAKGEVVSDFEAKLAKMNDEMTALGKDIKEVTLKAQRPSVSAEKADQVEAELKSFNLRAKAAAMEAGKSFTPLTAEQYGEYKATWANYLRKGLEGLSEAEKKTVNVGTSTQGGFLADHEMEAGIDRVVQRYSAIRQVARVIPIGSASYKKLVKTSGTSGASRGGENTTPSNGTSPGWVELEFKPGTYVSEQRITSEALEDVMQDIGADLEMEMGIEFAEMEGADFISGAGINGPRGFTDYENVANASYAWGKVGYVASGHASSWAAANPSDYLIDLVHALKRQYRAGASFVMNDATLGSIRKLKDGQGNYLWGMTKESFMSGAVGTLLGYSVVTDDFMADIGANAYPIAFGDFKQAYYVIERKGIAILRDPATAFPHVRFLARRRVGGGIAKFEALKLFKIATS
jgi:HK97 family phage major capsid protein